ncbi:MAG: hypothetical protein GY829_07955 [Gammaproteobacteria bacterium]|nr:hypothetical protein [Gammaproteobacteria bacterium]
MTRQVIINIIKQFSLTISLLIFIFMGMSANVLAENETKSLSIDTVTQAQVRLSFPFPSLLSTGPYLWYKNTKDMPIKGHAFRIATFSEESQYQIFIEKVEFGDDGCCLDIIDYRQLIINEELLRKHFPKYIGQHGFKLIRWINSEVFEFEAYGGTYQLTNISDEKPLIKELTGKSLK